MDGMVTLIILGIFAMMSLINSNYRVLQVLLAMVIGGAGTIEKELNRQVRKDLLPQDKAEQDVRLYHFPV